MILFEERPDWFTSGLCQGRIELAPLFYPDNEEQAEYALAREYCFRCPVKDQCRDYAIGHNIIFGMWGGLTPRERESYRRNPEAFMLRLRLCEGCGKTLRGRQISFCSSRCARLASGRRRRAGQTVPAICKGCGKEFSRRNPAQAYCVPGCRPTPQARLLKTRGQTVGCWVCGKPVEQRDTRTRYCSPPCQSKARTIKKRISRDSAS